jgi:hypothetical protein
MHSDSVFCFSECRRYVDHVKHFALQSHYIGLHEFCHISQRVLLITTKHQIRIISDLGYIYSALLHVTVKYNVYIMYI